MTDWRKLALSESFGCLCEGPVDDRLMRFPWRETFRTDRYRYSVNPGRDEGEELFDLPYQEVRQELMSELVHRVMMQECPLPLRDLVVIGVH